MRVSRRLIARTVILAVMMLIGAAQVHADVPPAHVEKRVDALLNQMAFEEKIDLLGGANLFDVRGVARLNVPAPAYRRWLTARAAWHDRRRR
jgi:hypothetical protein